SMASMRSRYASVASTGETSRWCMSAPRAVADRKGRSALFMPAPFMRRDDGQGLDLLQPWNLDTFKQILQRVEVIGHLGEQRAVERESHYTPQVLHLVL